MPWLQSSSKPADVAKWPHVCVVSVPVSDSITDKGSGVLVQTNPAIVLTAAHTFRESDRTRPPYVTFPATGESIWVTSVTLDSTNDVACITLQKAPKTFPAVVADEIPQAGEDVTIVGFAAARRFTAKACRVRGFNGQNALFAQCHVDQGMSGGPVYNSRGRLIGIISAGDSSETVVVTSRRCGIIRGIISRVLAPLRRPSVIVVPRHDHPTRPEDSTNQGGADHAQGAPAVSLSEKDFAKIADLVVERIAGDVRFKGPKGDPGSPGPPGQAGAPGKPAEVDLDALATRVAERLPKPEIDVQALAVAISKTLPPIHFRTVLPDGTVTDEEAVPLGGTLDITHYKLTPGGE